MISYMPIVYHRSRENTRYKSMKGDKKLRIRESKNTGTVARLMDTAELRDYTNLGHARAVELGKMAGAEVRVGRRQLWDRTKIDMYIDGLAGV